MNTPSSTRRLHTPAWPWYLKLLALLLALKAGLLLVDHTPMFFLGDSVSYINTSIGDWIPPDRSFLYGRLIAFFALRHGSLTPLLLAQSAATTIAALLGAWILRRHFNVPPRLAALMAILCVLEPLHLLYDRYVMTEAFALFAFALFTTAALHYLRGPSLPRLAFISLAGVLLVMLRVSFLPIIQTSVILVPLLALPALPARQRFARLGGHLVLSCVLFIVLHNSYKQYYASLIQHELPGAPPAYYYDNGFHLLAFVAPITQPSDFPDLAKADQIYANLAFDLHDFRNRDLHRWHPHGLIDNLKTAYPDHLQANRLADQTAWHAIFRNPLAEIALAAKGYADYWNLERLHKGLIVDRGGDRELPDDLLTALHKHYHLDGRPLPHLDTVTNRYFFLAWPWYLALLLLPIPAFAAIVVVPRSARPAAFLLFTFVCLQLAVIAAFSMSPTVRFLHPVAWLAMIVLGILLRTMIRRPRSIPEASPSEAPHAPRPDVPSALSV